MLSLFLCNRGGDGEESDLPQNYYFSVLTTLTVSQRWRFD